MLMLRRAANPGLAVDFSDAEVFDNIANLRHLSKRRAGSYGEVPSLIFVKGPGPTAIEY